MKTFLTLSFLALTASAAITRRADLFSNSKRDDYEGIRCSSREDCVSWYITGDSYCASGYAFTKYEVKGYVDGSYCEKKCSDDEFKQCSIDECNYNKAECLKNPVGAECSKALDICGEPIKMSQSFCNKAGIGRPVIYDASNETCYLDPNPKPDPDLKSLTIILQYDGTSEKQRLECATITTQGAKGIVSKLESIGLGSFDSTPTEDDYQNKDALRATYKTSFPMGSLEDSVLFTYIVNSCEGADHLGITKPILQESKIV